MALTQIKVYHGNELVANCPTMYVQPVAVPNEIWAMFKKMIFMDRASAGTVNGWSFTKEVG